MSNKTVRNMPKEEILYRLLEREYGFYQKILELTNEEHELFSCNLSIKSITDLMKQKKIVLGCIEEIEIALKPLKQYWSQKTDRNDPTSKHVETSLKKLDEIIQRILILDEKNQKLMQERMAQLHQPNR